jgi:hypothetical protein
VLTDRGGKGHLGDPEKTKNMFMSRHQTAGQNKWKKRVLRECAEFKTFWNKINNQCCNQKETEQIKYRKFLLPLGSTSLGLPSAI